MKKKYLAPMSEPISSFIIEDVCGSVTGGGTIGTSPTNMPEGKVRPGGGAPIRSL